MMLAEKRYKQKWSDDPRNTRWSGDQSKYGYRMLRQMGWSEGRGLGRREEGGTEHVRVTKRDGNTGVGFKKGCDDDWIEHQESFEQILAGLNTVQKDDTVTGSDCNKAKSLLSSAVNSRRAVYKRFLRSKDLSAVSSEDLDCVMGKRKRRRESGKQSAVKVGVPLDHGIKTITSKQSVQEYFAAKASSTHTAYIDTSEMLQSGADVASGTGTGVVASEAHVGDVDQSRCGVCGAGASGDHKELQVTAVHEEGDAEQAQKRKKASKKHKPRKQ